MMMARGTKHENDASSSIIAALRQKLEQRNGRQNPSAGIGYNEL